MWTFKTCWNADKPEWHESGQRFNNKEDAAKSMAEWAIVSAENGHMMPVCLVKIPRKAKEPS